MARPDHSSDSDRTAGLNDKYDKYDTDPKVKDVERDLDQIDSNSTGARIGRQIEMEAENGIKYRTCSWQKVNYCVPNFLLSYFPWVGPHPPRSRNPNFPRGVLRVHGTGGRGVENRDKRMGDTMGMQ